MGRAKSEVHLSVIIGTEFNKMVRSKDYSHVSNGPIVRFFDVNSSDALCIGVHGLDSITLVKQRLVLTNSVTHQSQLVG